MRQRTIELEKRSVNALSEMVVSEQMTNLANKSIGKTMRRFGWIAKEPNIKHDADEKGHTYEVGLCFTKRQERERDQSHIVFDKQFRDIARRVIQFGRSAGWRAKETQVNEATAKAIALTDGKQEFRIETPQEWQDYFSHIFDRDSQIRVIYSAIQAAKASEFKKRNHCLLWGKPACGKTEILLAFERMIGSENIVKLDAACMTKAGAENLLLEMDSVPPLLIIEEIEKTNEGNLPWLLGVMDSRGELIKTNARIGSVRREARCLVLATVNDLPLFIRLMSGALASRFQHKVYCPRPTRAILEKILLREIAELKGDRRWIKPVIEHCLDVEKTDDPRRLIACLDGREKLLDGSYQRDLMAIHSAMVADGQTPPPN